MNISSVFSHLRINLPGSTSSVWHCDFMTFLVAHRSPYEWLKLLDEEYTPRLVSSSSVRDHPISISQINPVVFRRLSILKFGRDLISSGEECSRNRSPFFLGYFHSSPFMSIFTIKHSGSKYSCCDGTV